MYHAMPVSREEDAVTPREHRRGTRLDKVPFPEGPLFTYRALMIMFGVAYKTLRNDVSEHRDKLGPKHFRRGANRKLSRLFTAADVEFLRTVYRIRVKP